jgi:DNA (cytosine-5)-methyltransferase 1
VAHVTDWRSERTAYSAAGKKVQVDLAQAVKRWPTPTVCGNYSRKGASPASGDGPATAVLKCATPTARDWKSGKASQATMERNSRPLSEQIGGSLNPTWVEWLMGWPLGWTDLKPLATDKSRCAQPQHGDC